MAEAYLAFAITPEYFDFDPLPEQLLEARMDADSADPATIAIAIALLDAIDGDSDFEPNGDEIDGDCNSDERLAIPRYRVDQLKAAREPSANASTHALAQTSNIAGSSL